MPSSSENDGKRAEPRLTSWWWIPSAVVILALLMLLIVPAEIDRRAAVMREAVTAGEHARTALNDFEAGLATELLLRAGGSSGAAHTPSDSLDADLAELRETVHRIDGDGLARFDSLSRQLGQWRNSLPEGARASSQQGLQLLESAEALDSYLAQYVDSHRTRAL